MVLMIEIRVVLIAIRLHIHCTKIHSHIFFPKTFVVLLIRIVRPPPVLPLRIFGL